MFTHNAFVFRIMDLGSHFMEFPLGKEFKHFLCTCDGKRLNSISFLFILFCFRSLSYELLSETVDCAEKDSGGKAYTFSISNNN